MSIYGHNYRGSSGLVNGVRMLHDSYGAALLLTALVGVLFERNEPALARHIDRCLATLPPTTAPIPDAFPGRS